MKKKLSEMEKNDLEVDKASDYLKKYILKGYRSKTFKEELI